MAYYNKQKEDINVSQWNEAQLKMFRINTLQERINDLWTNPLAFNDEAGKYNFELLFQSIISYWYEVRPKTNNTEMEEMDKIVNVVENFMDQNQIIKKKTIESPATYINQHVPSGFTTDINKWKILRKLLRKLEGDIKGLAELHGLSGKNKEDDSGL